MNRSGAFGARGIALLTILLSIGACSTMSGLSGESHYACQAPNGVACDSVSGTYANAIQNNLPSQRAPSRTPPPANEASPPDASSAATAPGFDPIATPLRSAPRVLRLWFKPWEDADQDLYDQGYVYVQIDAGRWLIEHAQRAIRDTYRPLQPPPAATEPDKAKSEAPPPAPFPPITMPSKDVP